MPLFLTCLTNFYPTHITELLRTLAIDLHRLVRVSIISTYLTAPVDWWRRGNHGKNSEVHFTYLLTNQAH
jgi:hypothetical protein